SSSINADITMRRAANRSAGTGSVHQRIRLSGHGSQGRTPTTADRGSCGLDSSAVLLMATNQRVRASGRKLQRAENYWHRGSGAATEPEHDPSAPRYSNGEGGSAQGSHKRARAKWPASACLHPNALGDTDSHAIPDKPESRGPDL